jgi:hypothetical protein
MILTGIFPDLCLEEEFQAGAIKQVSLTLTFTIKYTHLTINAPWIIARLYLQQLLYYATAVVLFSTAVDIR